MSIVRKCLSPLVAERTLCLSFGFENIIRDLWQWRICNRENPSFSGKEIATLVSGRVGLLPLNILTLRMLLLSPPPLSPPSPTPLTPCTQGRAQPFIARGVESPGDTPLYGLYRHVRPQNGVWFVHLSLELGMFFLVFRRNYFLHD